MNSIGFLFYSLLFAFNQIYKLVLWPAATIELMESSSSIMGDTGSFHLDPSSFIEHDLIPIYSTLQFKFLIGVTFIAIIIQVLKSALNTEYLYEDNFIVNSVKPITNIYDGVNTIDSINEDISYFYPAASIGFNRSSLRIHTILDKPSDLLIWDRKNFNSL